MLYQPKQVIKNLLKSPNKCYYFCILTNTNIDFCTKISMLKQKMKKQLDIQIILVSSVQQIKQNVINNSDISEYVVVCYKGNWDDVKVLRRCKVMLGVIQVQQFNGQTTIEYCYTGECYFHKKIYNIQTLIDEIKGYQKKQTLRKQLPNFIKIKSQVCKSNMLIKSMISMISLKNNKTTRKQILDNLQHILHQLIKSIPNYLNGRQKQLKRLLTQLKKGPMMSKTIISMYTSQVGFYAIVNNILRSAIHPCQIFYIQPFFKDLFLTIKSIYVGNRYCQFVCYRGGTLFQSQARQMEESVGDIVQNLGFLSTSLNQAISMNFMSNAFFQIQVPASVFTPCQKHMLFDDFGYAYVQDFSQFFEEEVIFNPLNSFKISEITCKQYLGLPNQINKKYFIKIRYINTQELRNKKQSQFNENEKFLELLIKCQRQEIKNYQFQGSVFSSITKPINHRSQYWSKFYNISSKWKDKILGIMEWGDSEVQNRRYQQAQRILMRGVEIFREIDVLFDIQVFLSENYSFRLEQFNKFYNEQPQNKDIVYNFILVVNHLGNLFSLEGKQEKGIKIFQGALLLISKLFGQNNYTFFQSLNCLACVLFKQCKYNEALKVYESCHTYEGQNYIDYLNILNNMSNICMKLSKNEQACNQLQKCLQLTQQIYGDEHPEYFVVANNLCIVYLSMNRTKQSKQLLQRCLKKQIELSYAEKQCYIVTLSTLAECYHMEGRNEEALKLFEKSIDLNAKLFGYNIDYYLILENMSNCLYETGQCQEAIYTMQLCQRQIKILVGDQSPKYIECLYNLANLYSDTNNPQSSISLYQKCKQLLQQKIEDTRTLYIKTLINLSCTYKNLNSLSKAQQNLLQCIQQIKKYFGKDILQLKMVLINLGEIYSLKFMCEKAEEVVLGVLDQLEDKGNWDSRGRSQGAVWMMGLGKLGDVYFKQRKYQLALVQYQKAYNYKRQFFGQHQRQTLKSLKTMATCYQHLSEQKKAIALYHQYLHQTTSLSSTPSTPSTPSNISQLSQIYLGLGNCYCNQFKFKQGIYYYKICYKLRSTLYGQKNQLCIMVLYNIAISYSNIGQYGRALVLLIFCWRRQACFYSDWVGFNLGLHLCEMCLGLGLYRTAGVIQKKYRHTYLNNKSDKYINMHHMNIDQKILIQKHKKALIIESKSKTMKRKVKKHTNYLDFRLMIDQ